MRGLWNSRAACVRSGMVACSMSVAALGVASIVPQGAGAQTAAVPMVELAPADARATVTFGNVFGVAPLANGRVLVNDGVRRRLTILDGALSHPVVLLDSVATASAGWYGYRPIPLIRFAADSLLFVDVTAHVFQVIAPSGAITRVLAIPKTADEFRIVNSQSATDARGNLVYRSMQPTQNLVKNAAGAAHIESPKDSATVLRANFETRTVDTLAKVNPLVLPSVYVMADGRMHSLINPLPAVDEWAVLADGSVAVIRGHDYHIDWIAPDGKRFSSPKLPFDFKRITDDDKRALMDSARKAIKIEENEAFRRMVAQRASGMADEALPVAAAGSGRGAQSVRQIPLPSTPNHKVVDVVNNRGELQKRVRMPVGRSVAGFGKGGVVFLMGRENSGEWYLERTRVK